MNVTGTGHKRLKRLIRMLLLYLGLPYLIICVLLAIVQRQMLYPARAVTSADVAEAIGHQIHIKPLEVTTSDQLKLHGLLVEASSGGWVEQGGSELQVSAAAELM